MGLLDEAIRQHLELKRQHGASDEELQMQEQEALGPVRREPVEPAAEAPEHEEHAPEYAAEADLDRTDDADIEQAFAAPEATVAPDVAVDEGEPLEGIAGEADLDDLPVEDLDDLPVEELDDPIHAYGEPGAAAVEPPTEALPPEEGYEPVTSEEDTPSGGFEALREPAPTPEEGDEDEDDVLEETPEFLQETPEHDRLWFEQKPPRDFDFDE